MSPKYRPSPKHQAIYRQLPTDKLQELRRRAVGSMDGLRNRIRDIDTIISERAREGTTDSGKGKAAHGGPRSRA